MIISQIVCDAASLHRFPRYSKSRHLSYQSEAGYDKLPKTVYTRDSRERLPRNSEDVDQERPTKGQADIADINELANKVEREFRVYIVDALKILLKRTAMELKSTLYVEKPDCKNNPNIASPMASITNKTSIPPLMNTSSTTATNATTLATKLASATTVPIRTSTVKGRRDLRTGDGPDVIYSNNDMDPDSELDASLQNINEGRIAKSADMNESSEEDGADGILDHAIPRDVHDDDDDDNDVLRLRSNRDIRDELVDGDEYDLQ